MKKSEEESSDVASKFCKVCKLRFMSEKEWRQHVSGSDHFKNLGRKKPTKNEDKRCFEDLGLDPVSSDEDEFDQTPAGTLHGMDLVSDVSSSGDELLDNLQEHGVLQRSGEKEPKPKSTWNDIEKRLPGEIIKIEKNVEKNSSRERHDKSRHRATVDKVQHEKSEEKKAHAECNDVSDTSTESVKEKDIQGPSGNDKEKERDSKKEKKDILKALKRCQVCKNVPIRKRKLNEHVLDDTHKHAVKDLLKLVVTKSAPLSGVQLALDSVHPLCGLRFLLEVRDNEEDPTCGHFRCEMCAVYCHTSEVLLEHLNSRQHCSNFLIIIVGERISAEDSDEDVLNKARATVKGKIKMRVRSLEEYKQLKKEEAEQEKREHEAKIKKQQKEFERPMKERHLSSKGKRKSCDDIQKISVFKIPKKRAYSKTMREPLNDRQRKIMRTEKGKFFDSQDPADWKRNPARERESPPYDVRHAGTVYMALPAKAVAYILCCLEARK